MTDFNPIRDQRGEEVQETIDWEDRYKRLAAELDNTKKRLAKNSAETIERMQDQLLLEMLPLADNLERILRNQVNDSHCAQLRDGIRLTYRDFQNALKRYGIEQMQALNRPFDPNFHEATALVNRPSQPGGIVVEVLQSGYLRDGRVLRPARVVVSSD
jgi:molecular chaperone GrpE